MGHSITIIEHSQKKIFDDPYVDIRIGQNKVKKIIDEIPIIPPVLDIPIPPKYDDPGFLPFALATPHHYHAYLSKEEQNKVSMQMYDTMIQQAQYQIDMLNAHVDSLIKLRDKLKENQ